MFQAIGRSVDRYRIILIAIWVIAAIGITAVAPNLEDIATNDTEDFLPASAPSIEGQALVDQYFPGGFDAGSITLVFEAGEDAPITADANVMTVAAVSEWLVSDAAPAGVQSVQSPTLNPEAAAALIAPDGEIAIVAVGLDLSADIELLLADVSAQIADAPGAATVYLTGESAIFSDYDATITETVDQTLVVTLALVVVILLVIYRSPVSPFIPLTVVTLAYLVARGIVGFLGEAEVFSVSGTASMLLIVVMYGSGTDYCLFLINRFREELANGQDSSGGVRRTVRYVGEAITNSAGTTVTGFIAMATAQLGLFNTAGPTLAIGIVTSLLAGLTLTPSILGLLGQRAFWPGKATQREASFIYKRTSQFISARPLLTIGVVVLALAPFAVYGAGYQSTYDTLADLPEDVASVQGFRLMEEHLGAGNIQPTTIVAELDAAGDPLAQVTALTAEITALDGVASVRSASQPFGDMPMSANISEEEASALQAQGEAMAATFLSTNADAARFEVVLADNPYSLTAMDTIDDIRVLLDETATGETSIVGATAINTDIRDTLQLDLQRTIVLVIGGIFIVLAVMLRSLVAPMYLIATILLSFATTIGITRIASEVLWDAEQFVWWVPFFVFVFLVTLGIDYAIFLFGRIKEEARTHGVEGGITSAVQATGGIITSAGIIVAGTFGALMGGDILGLAQIGFAVGVGILVDTMIIRTILDPALATAFGRWTWWPGNATVDNRPADDPRRTTGTLQPVASEGMD